MKIKPKLAFSYYGIHGNHLDPRKVYPCIPADNQPDWKEQGKIFVPFDPEDENVDGDSIMLEKGDYEIQIDPEALYWASFNRFELRLPGQCVLDCSGPGRADDAVEYWTPKVREQAEKDGFHNAPTPEKIASELKEYGAWEAHELEDLDTNWQRLVWIAAGNIREDDERDCSEPEGPYGPLHGMLEEIKQHAPEGGPHGPLHGMLEEIKQGGKLS